MAIEGVIDWDFAEGSLFDRIIRRHVAKEEEVGQRVGGLRFGIFLGWIWNLKPYGTIFPTPARGDWYQYEHQAGGHGCWQCKFVIRPLDATPEFLDFARRLVIDYDQYGGGWFDPDHMSPGDYSEYRQRLAAFGLTIEEPLIKTFMEAQYPIDLTPENLGRVTGDTRGYEDVRAALDDLGEQSDWVRGAGIFILADNSD